MLKFDQKLFDQHTEWALRLAHELMSHRCREVNQQFLPYQIEQAALVGLWQSVVRYEPARGEFKPFARLRILGCVKDEYRSNGIVDWRSKAKVVSIEGMNL